MNLFADTNLKLIISAICLVYSLIMIQNSAPLSAMRHFAFTESSLSLWYLFSSLQLQISNTDVVILLCSLVYVCGEFACASAFLYCYLTTRIVAENHRKLTAAVYSIPTIAIVITIFSFVFFKINPYLAVPEPFFSEQAPLPYKDYLFRKRALYFFHCAYCYLMLLTMIVMLCRNIIKKPQENKRLMLLIVLGTICFFIPNFYRIYLENFNRAATINHSPIFESLSFFFMSTIVFCTVFFDKNERNTNICKTKFYESSGMPIFIFTADMKFLQSNNIGMKFLKDYDINVELFDSVKKIFPPEKMRILGISNNPSTASDCAFYISSEKDKKLYYAQKQETKNRFSGICGYFIALSKIDLYSELIKNLEQKAYTNGITGCKNKAVFLQYLAGKLREKSDIQLVCTASVENLDNLYEKAGIVKTDAYIKQFSEILKKCITEVDGLVEKNVYNETPEIFQLSSSLFAFILSEQYENIISVLFKSIRTACENFSRNKPAPLTCALGYSATGGASSDFEQVIQQSWQNMLFDRRNSNGI